MKYVFDKNRKSAYQQKCQQALEAWWTCHRDTAALLETVLLAPACSTPEPIHSLFNPDLLPPAVTQTPEGAVLRLPGISASDPTERERELARQLVLKWREQRGEPAALQPLQCYWQGSSQAWQAFAEQMAHTCPQVTLPEQPKPWQGIDSLGSLIGQLEDAPDDARILCAGCQSSPASQGSPLLAGEAALLWVLGRRGGVRLGRGEWYVAGMEDLAQVTARALQQSELEAPPDTCVSFFHVHVPDLSAVGWSPRQQLLDVHLGDLAGLKPLLVQTLAAAWVQHRQAPCAWLASDPHYALTLGVVRPDDPSLPHRRPVEDLWRKPCGNSAWRS